MSETKFTPQLREPRDIPAYRGGNEAGQYLEKAAKEAGSIFGIGIKYKDDKNQDGIKKQAEDIGRNIEADSSFNFDLDQSEKENLRKLGLAAEYRTVSRTEAVLRANQAAKDLKGKYPGYEDIIDAEVDKRVFGGLRGKVLQEAFDQLTEAEKAAAKKAQDDEDFFNKASAKGAFIYPSEGTVSTITVNGTTIDRERTQSNMSRLEKIEADRSRAQADLTYYRGNKEYSILNREDKLLTTSRELGNLAAQELALTHVPELLRQGVAARADGKVDPKELIQLRTAADTIYNNYIQTFTKKSDMSVAEAAEALAPVKTVLYNALNIYGADDVTDLNVFNKINEADVAMGQSVLLYDKDFKFLSVVKSALGDGALAPEFFNKLGINFNDKKFENFVNGVNSNDPGLFVSVNTPEGSKERQATYDLSYKAVKNTLNNLTPEKEESLIISLNLLTAGRDALLNDPHAAKAYLNKIYSKGAAEKIFKVWDAHAGDKRVEVARNVTVEASKGLLQQGLRELSRELANDPSIKEKDITKAFTYDPASGKLSISGAKRTRNVAVRSVGQTGEIVKPTAALNSIHLSLQTAIDVLRANGDEELVNNLATDYKWMPIETKDTKQ